MLYVDLNCDLGESFGTYTIGDDAHVIPLITSANIACGFHASDPLVMAKTVKLAAESGIAVGAHPGFPDLQGFGRREMKCTPDEVKAYVQYQIGALQAFANEHKITLQHVKAHGAMYNMAAVDIHMARAIAEGIAAVDNNLILMGLAGSRMIDAAKEVGLPYASEVFADRAYEEDGSLVSRRKPGAMITDEDEAAARVIRMVKEGKVTAITGKDIYVQADSICVHGDNAKAFAFVERLRKELKDAGIEIRPLHDFIRTTCAE